MTIRPVAIGSYLFSPFPSMQRHIQYSPWQSPSQGDPFADRGDELRSGIFNDTVFTATFRESRMAGGAQNHLIGESILIRARPFSVVVGIALTLGALAAGIVAWRLFTYPTIERADIAPGATDSRVEPAMTAGGSAQHRSTLDYAGRRMVTTGNPFAQASLWLGILTVLAFGAAVVVTSVVVVVFVAGCLSIVFGAFAARKAFRASKNTPLNYAAVASR